MRTFIKNIFLILCLILLPITSYGSWAEFSDIELVNQSDVIVNAELIGQTQVTINQFKYVIGVLKVEGVLKGDKNQAVILLALPSTEGPRSSIDIFYENGQNGLWFLREQKAKGETGMYLADHPQRFVSEKQADAQIAIIRNILKDKKTDTIK